jgi:hypothetical protein
MKRLARNPVVVAPPNRFSRAFVTVATDFAKWASSRLWTTGIPAARWPDIPEARHRLQS